MSNTGKAEMKTCAREG